MTDDNRTCELMTEPHSIIEESVPEESSASLIAGLLARETRAEAFLRWHAERCIPAPEYTDEIDAKLLGALIDQVADRIDRADSIRSDLLDLEENVEKLAKASSDEEW